MRLPFLWPRRMRPWLGHLSGGFHRVIASGAVRSETDVSAIDNVVAAEALNRSPTLDRKRFGSSHHVRCKVHAAAPAAVFPE